MMNDCVSILEVSVLYCLRLKTKVVVNLDICDTLSNALKNNSKVRND